MKENFLKIGDRIAVPHHCDVCDKVFLNYIDDVDFLKNEEDWEIGKMSCGAVYMEICGDCKKGN